MNKPKNKYRGGRPKGIKNGETSVSKGKLWETQEDKERLWKQAEQKIKAEYSGRSEGKPNSVIYKTWYCDLQQEDIDGLTNEELDSLIYDYKGNIHLWRQGTKEKGFNGKYKY